ncbi:hypothetical protein JKG47_19040 [Acidithiobacillus sp. MC6.1]|nr:hypothetical protein [Acidithiobacillus sp. MC6.1]
MSNTQYYPRFRALPTNPTTWRLFCGHRILPVSCPDGWCGVEGKERGPGLMPSRCPAAGSCPDFFLFLPPKHHRWQVSAPSGLKPDGVIFI